MCRRVILFFVFLLYIGINLGHAQWMPTPRTIQTPYGKATITDYHYHHTPPIAYYGKAESKISPKRTFFLVLPNDSIISTFAMIKLEETNYIKVKDKDGNKIYYPKDTKSIYRIQPQSKMKVEGIPADSCWLFKTTTGKINAYSFVAEPGTSKIIAIQQGDNGPILPLTEENLVAMVGTANKKINYNIKYKSYNR